MFVRFEPRGDMWEVFLLPGAFNRPLKLIVDDIELVLCEFGAVEEVRFKIDEISACFRWLINSQAFEICTSNDLASLGHRADRFPQESNGIRLGADTPAELVIQRFLIVDIFLQDSQFKFAFFLG